jgi:hypothetical protein
MLHIMHGKIYGGVEYGIKTVHYEDTTGVRERSWRWGNVLSGDIGKGRGEIASPMELV